MERRTVFRSNRVELSTTQYLVTYGTGYLCTFSGVLKIIQIVFGIIVCCCAGIYCHRGSSCTTNFTQYDGVEGQGFVIAVGVAGIAFSFYFLLVYLLKCCTGFNWLKTELIFLVVISVLYLIAAAVETYYATARKYQQWSNFQAVWSAATAFAWMTFGLYITDFIYLFFTKRRSA